MNFLKHRFAVPFAEITKIVFCSMILIINCKQGVCLQEFGAEISEVQSVYAKDVNDLKLKLLTAFQIQEDEILKNKQLKLPELIQSLDMLKQQKEAFDTDGLKLPSHPAMKRHVTAYQNEVEAIKKRFLTSLNKLADKYREKRDIDNVKAVLEVIQSNQFAKPINTETGKNLNARENLRLKLLETTWQHAEGYKGTKGHSITFMNDGIAKHNVPPSTPLSSWAVLDEKRIAITFANGFVEIWKFNNDGISYDCMQQDGNTFRYSGKKLGQ